MIMPDPRRIMSMANAFYQSCILFAASDMGIFDALARKKKATLQELVDTCNLDPRGGRLLLDGCVALKLLVKSDEYYANTDDSTFFLVSESPCNLSQAIRYNRDVYGAWQMLPNLVKTGEPVEKPELHLGDDKERTRTFVLSMHGRALGIGRLLVPQLKLKGCRQIFDVGGGPGTYSVLIAKDNPEVRCTVLDLPEVVKVASELIEQQGMSKQVRTMPGDYHEVEFPSGNDAVLFFGMLHQESPEAILNLLGKAHEALNPGGKVFIMDMMTDATHTAPVFSALFAVNMALTTANGWVFSDKELRHWLSEAGFSGVSVNPLPSPMPHWLATAVKKQGT
jgi:ubiquinone/menaquinone biosynthesis C-methylase UbiE